MLKRAEMILSKDDLCGILKRAGWSDEAIAIARQDSRLPDVIDTDRDQAVLEALGMNRSKLEERMGGSP